jgi:hypothetical protein
MWIHRWWYWLLFGDHLAMKSGDQRCPVYLFFSVTFVVCKAVSSFGKTLVPVKNKCATIALLHRSSFHQINSFQGLFPTYWQNLMTALTWVQSDVAFFTFFTLTPTLPLTCYLKYLTADWCHFFKCRHGKMFWCFCAVSHDFKKNKLIFLTKRVIINCFFSPCAGCALLGFYKYPWQPS